MPRLTSAFIPLVLLLPLVLPASSFGPSQAQDSSIAIDTLPNGAIQVQNTGSGLWDEGTRWGLQEVYRLGVVEGGGPEQFGGVLTIRADSLNRAYVFDVMALEIRVFDSLGVYLHSMGGRGPGPGEFLGPIGVDVAPDGTVWTEGVSNARYSVFSPDGEYQEGFRREVGGVIVPSPSGYSPQHGYVDWANGRQPGAGDRDPNGSWSIRQPVVFTPPAQYDTMPPLSVWQENASDGNRSPGAESLVTHVAADGNLWFAHGSEYRIFRRTLEGDTTLVVTLDASPAEWSGAERDSILAHYRDQRRPDLKMSDIPRQKRVVRKIFTDGSGHLFVLPQVSGVEAGTAVDVFRESGQYLGRLALPERIVLGNVTPDATRNRLYVLCMDEYDVSYVVSWRFVKP